MKEPSLTPDQLPTGPTNRTAPTPAKKSKVGDGSDVQDTVMGDDGNTASSSTANPGGTVITHTDGDVN